MQEADRKAVWALVVTLSVIAAEIALTMLIAPASCSANHSAGAAHQYDLSWQDSSAVWTAVFTFFLTVSTALLWWQTKRLAEGADDQARLTRDMFIAEYRPWVEAEPTGDGIIRWGKGYIEIDIPISVINIGRTPATDTEIFIKPILDRYSLPTSAAVRKWAKSIEEFGGGEILFSDGQVFEKRTVLSRTKIDDWLGQHEKSGHRIDWISPDFFVCIRYRTRLTKELFYTAFALATTKMTPNFGYVREIGLQHEGTVTEIRVEKIAEVGFAT